MDRSNQRRTRKLSHCGGLFAVGLLALLASVPAPVLAVGQPAATIDFNRDVRPILSENCFACHGFDANQRQAGLRLDTEEGAHQRLASGNRAVVPSDPKVSGLVQRVTAQNALRMPPASTGKQLTPAQVATLRAWIEQGGQYSQHWAFVRPRRPALPAVKNAKWPLNPIDRFILARLEKERLQPSPPADRYTLIRRVTLDLTGLPPTPAEVDAFLADRKPGAYERLVDRLLVSPHYGERMALPWLDLARYADTHGYHIDSHRDMWIWRDWVIDAFNRNLPFDQFTIQQIAGDLLPDATQEQKIATGFNRNHPINYEGGAIPEEYHAAYIIDRIDTTATAWMGLTMKCAQCHDHKYDPFTQQEFYQLYAFFHNVPEAGLDGQRGNAKPFLKLPRPMDEVHTTALKDRLDRWEQAMKARAGTSASAQAAWEQAMLASPDRLPTVSNGLVGHFGSSSPRQSESGSTRRHGDSEATEGAGRRQPGLIGQALQFDGKPSLDLGPILERDRDKSFSYGAWVYPTAQEAMAVLSRMEDGAGLRGWDLFLDEGKVYAHLIHEWPENAIRVVTKKPIELNEWQHLFVTYDGTSKAKGVRLYVNGKQAELEVTHDGLKESIQTDGPVRVGRRGASALFRGRIDEVRLYDRELSAAEVEQLHRMDTIRQILVTPGDQRSDEQKTTLSKYYLENHDDPYRKLSAELAAWRSKQTQLDEAIPGTMVMAELEKPRETYMLIRGEYDKKGEKVTAGMPAVLPPLPKGAPANRLGLARWLVDPSHPLTARVAINHYWQNYFGTGLVRTPEDFGTQGERPSHPELLDWLATEYVRTGWNMKAMQRLIVTSATYRQSSRVTPELLAKDPENRLLARAPRLRLPAEHIRDQALAISGLLVEKIGGPPVNPYQPPGLWEEISFGAGFTAQTYEQDHGEALYRRSMYTFWKRTVPPPALQTFDAPEREFCVVRRSVTNTPLQALVLMNDPTYVEASRKFAERILTEGGISSPQRITFAFRHAVARPPKPAEMKVLLRVLNEQKSAFRKDPVGAEKLLSVGESKRNEKLDVSELAAWTSVASVILNLDETITRG